MSLQHNNAYNQNNNTLNFDKMNEREILATKTINKIIDSIIADKEKYTVKFHYDTDHVGVYFSCSVSVPCHEFQQIIKAISKVFIEDHITLIKSEYYPEHNQGIIRYSLNDLNG